MDIKDAIDEGEQLVANSSKKDTKKDPFEERRRLNPQGVIDDLIAQTTRQAKVIHEKNLGQAVL
jgi:hypothetical protein